MSEFSKLIIDFMSTLSITDEECAILLDVSINTIHNWERGRTKPNTLMLGPIYKTLLEEALRSFIGPAIAS